MSVLWRDKVLSSYNGNIESVVVYDAEGANQVEAPNGVFITLAGMEKNGRELKKAVLAEDPTKEVLLISTPEVVYEGSTDLEDFVNEAGDVSRAFRLADGDVISLTEDLITEPTTLAVNDTLIVGAGGKLVEAVDLEADTAIIKFVVREDAGKELTRKQDAWRCDIVR